MSDAIDKGVCAKLADAFEARAEEWITRTSMRKATKGRGADFAVIAALAEIAAVFREAAA